MELICRAAAQADLPACCNVFADSEIYERYFSAPGARGRGVGHFLLAEFEAMARVQGAGRVALMVSDFNEKAQALYRSLGYLELGRLPDAVRKGVSELVLIKDL